MPSPVNPPAGCHFHTRCWLREQLGNPEQCVSAEPELREIDPGHRVKCHFAEQVSSAKAAEFAADQPAVTAAAPAPAGA